MSGSHLIPDDDVIITHALGESNTAIRVEGLKQWVKNLHVIGETQAYLKAQDKETGEIFLIKQVVEIKTPVVE